jgi:hypothetical protein
VVKDAIVLLTHLNELRKQRPETDLRQLVAGVLPIAYGLGGANLFMAPMALTLGYGLIFATTLTLILVPCLYMIGQDVRKLFIKKK